MKKFAILFAGLFMMTFAFQTVNAQGSGATAASSAAARIITPIALTNSTGLNFGNIAASDVLGTVTIAPAGGRTSTGGVTPSAIGAFTNAIFGASGEFNATYAITLPASTTVSDGGSNSMTINGFTSDPSGTGTLSGIGSQTINVGATLNVNASQASGNYTGTYNVTIAYN